MAILANRVKNRNHLADFTKFLLYFIGRFFTVFLIILSLYLIYFSPPVFIKQTSLELAGKVSDFSNFIYSGFNNTIGYAYNRFAYLQNLEEENLRLKSELQSLLETKSSEQALRLENESLRKMLNVPRNSSNNFVTTKVIGILMTPFSSSAVIKAGTNQGIKINDIVKGEYGLIGKVSEVSSNFANVMLVTDPNSRIPIYCRENRGILVKQENDLKVIYLNRNHDIKVGDIVKTSGDGKVFSKDIPVAVVKSVNGSEVLVKTLAGVKEIDFVIVDHFI